MGRHHCLILALFPVSSKLNLQRSYQFIFIFYELYEVNTWYICAADVVNLSFKLSGVDHIFQPSVHGIGWGRQAGLDAGHIGIFVPELS